MTNPWNTYRAVLASEIEEAARLRLQEQAEEWERVSHVGCWEVGFHTMDSTGRSFVIYLGHDPWTGARRGPPRFEELIAFRGQNYAGQSASLTR